MLGHNKYDLTKISPEQYKTQKRLAEELLRLIIRQAYHDGEI